MKKHLKPYSGLFISIEGGDGAGKSTLAQNLSEELEKKGKKVLKTREPGGTTLGEHLRELLLNPKSTLKIGERAELFLFLAARVQHMEEVILPALQQGKIVIIERFHDSSVAYQGCARHLGMAYVEELCSLSTCEVEPDCTLFLDIDPEVGLKRAKSSRNEKVDRIEKEELQFHKEVRQGFLHLADDYSERITILDATLPLDEVTKKALSIVTSLLVK